MTNGIVGHIRSEMQVVFKVRWADGGRGMETHVDVPVVRGDNYVLTLEWRGGATVARLKNLTTGDVRMVYGEIIPVKPRSWAMGATSDEWNAVLGDRDGMALEFKVRKEG